MSTVSGDRHTLRQPIYHGIVIPAAGGATTNTAFQNATAQARGYLQNLGQNGSLPEPDYFELFSPRIVPALAAAVSDKELVVSSQSEIWVNNRTFFEGPSWLMPSGAGFTGFAGAAAAATTSAHGVPTPDAVINLGKRSLEIGPNQQFRHVMSHANTTLPVAAVLTHFVWDGLYTRHAQ